RAAAALDLVAPGPGASALGRGLRACDAAGIRAVAAASAVGASAVGGRGRRGGPAGVVARGRVTARRRRRVAAAGRRGLVGSPAGGACIAADGAGVRGASCRGASVRLPSVATRGLGIRACTAHCGAVLLHVRDLHVDLSGDVGLESARIRHTATPAAGQCAGREGESDDTCAGDQELPKHVVTPFGDRGYTSTRTPGRRARVGTIRGTSRGALGGAGRQSAAYRSTPAPVARAPEPTTAAPGGARRARRLPR